MIPEAMIKSMAREHSVDPAVIDRDHALGVVLWAMSTQSHSQDWVFKGGTCLRKCHFGDYRFSEDLDFTVTGSLRVAAVSAAIASCAQAAGSQGVRLKLDEMRVEVMNDEYGRESIEIKVPYRGALRMGSAQNVQLHLSADEELAFGPVTRPLLHPYADAADVECRIRAYALEEILAEKLRAAGGQRRHAVARDIYDIASLVRRGADVDSAVSALPFKAACKAVNLSDACSRFLACRAEYQVSWDRTLAYLVVDDLSFQDAFSVTADLLGRF